MAKNLSLDIVGVSFHVGSGCGDPQAFVKAVRAANLVWREAVAQGFDMQILDIGGGFPGTEAAISFTDIALHCQRAIQEYFPGVTVIGEPGRFFAAASHSLITTVVNKRVVHTQNTAMDATGNATGGIQEEYQYYLNDGVYQSFNCLFFDHAKVSPIALPRYGCAVSTSARGTTMFGPTCDGLDCVIRGISFPELELGDWVLFPNMGAYTVAAASPFNGYYKWNYVYVNTFDVQKERELLLRNVRKINSIAGCGRGTVAGFKAKAGVGQVAEEALLLQVMSES